jgi:hypothetical protein
MDFSNVSVHKGVENPNLHRMKKYNIIELKYDYNKVARIKDNLDTQEIIVVNY